MAAVHAHGKAHGYNVVIKSSSMPTEKKPGRTAKIWLRCDRGGHYRPRNGLTEETRKRRRTSRLMDCPFMIVAAGTPGMWSLNIMNPTHNHGPVIERPRQAPQQRVKRGQILAVPYDWPHDATMTPFTTALVMVDLQKDCTLHSFLDANANANEFQYVRLGAIWIIKVMILTMLCLLYQNFNVFYILSVLVDFLYTTLVKVSQYIHT